MIYESFGMSITYKHIQWVWNTAMLEGCGSGSWEKLI